MSQSNSSNIQRMAVKAMGLFGGVQVVQILCSIVRTKLVALWIGTVGVGLFGLFNLALEMINMATNLGVRNSSVRDISQALERGGHTHAAHVVAVVRRWSRWLALAGAALTIACSPLLSQLTFGNSEHTWGFVALSIAVALMALTNGEQAILQGSAQLKRLASVTMWGTLGGLIVSIPLFYWLREQSIVPSIIAYAACMAIAALCRRDRHERVKVSAHETWHTGRDFVKLGIAMTIGSLAALLASYAFQAWLNNTSGTSEVGLYQAGYTLVNKYAGLILSALGMEYFPRLARVANSRMRLRTYMSQEIGLAMTIMTPVIAIMMVLREPIVLLLYSSDFTPVSTFVAWALLGTMLRAFSWCMAFVILAKGSGRVYIVTETLSAVLGLALNIVCYQQWGLSGLGASYLLWYAAYSIIVWVVCRCIYHINVSGKALLATTWSVVCTGAVMALSLCSLTAMAWGMVALSIGIALWQLRAMLAGKSSLKKIKG